MKAVLFAAGELKGSDWLRERCAEADLLIAVDGGLSHMLAMELRPDLLVGDLDSVTAADLQQAGKVERLTFPADKSATDLELALEAAALRGATDILVAGALGARQDHNLANLLLATRWHQPGRLRLWLAGDGTIAWPLNSGEELLLPGAGMIFSVLATRTGTTVSISGARYGLTEAELPYGSGLGVSNVVTTRSQVSVQSGTVIVMVLTDAV